MGLRILNRLLQTVLIGFLIGSMPAMSQQVKPYRVLLVISNQWKDPASFLVTSGPCSLGNCRR